MRRFINFSVLSILCLTLLLSFGCSGKRRPAAVPRPEGHLAVAGFTNPVYNWEILAGYIDEEGKPVPDGTMEVLDQVLAEALERHKVFDYMTPTQVQPCEDVVVFEESGKPKTSAWKYWLGVAKCTQADYLLVPTLTRWTERVGSDMGVESPASVALDFYLIDVKNERFIRSRYDETQVSLFENFLTASKFSDRGGKWVTATRIATDGIEEKLLELGL